MTDIAEFVEPLRRLHDWIRGLVIGACEQQASAELAKVVEDGAGDVTYAIDRVSEEALVDWFTREIAAGRVLDLELHAVLGDPRVS